MKETLYSRNAVYETLLARRRQAFSLEIAEGAQEKGRISDILRFAKERKIPVKRVPRGRLERLHANHQGVALEASGYPYADLTDIFELAEERKEPLFVLLLDTLNDPQNFGTLLRTAEVVGCTAWSSPWRGRWESHRRWSMPRRGRPSICWWRRPICRRPSMR